MFVAGYHGHEFLSTEGQQLITFLSLKDQRLTPFKSYQQTKLPLGLLTPPATCPVKLDVNTTMKGGRSKLSTHPASALHPYSTVTERLCKNT